MILGFNKRLVAKIIEGAALHTIRDDRSDRWRDGRILHMVTGWRTRRQKQFAKKICISCQVFEIHWHQTQVYDIKIDNRILIPKEILDLAINEGFSSIQQFTEYFRGNFKGKIIHWTELRY